MKMKRYVALLAVNLGAFGLLEASCSHAKPDIAQAEPTPPAPAATPVTPAPPPALAPAPVAETMQPQACSSDNQCTASQLCIQSTCTDITPALAECGISRVHFDFDKADLHPSDRFVLDRAIRCLNVSHTHLLVTGNCDERGSVRYNLGLGKRRARAVESYLKNGGVPATQMEIVTYGKELPVCTARDETCWSQNRRASLEPNGVAKDIRQLIRRDELAEAGMQKTMAGAQASAAGAAKKHPNMQGRRHSP